MIFLLCYFDCSPWNELESEILRVSKDALEIVVQRLPSAAEGDAEATRALHERLTALNPDGVAVALSSDIDPASLELLRTVKAMRLPVLALGTSTAMELPVLEAGADEFLLREKIPTEFLRSARKTVARGLTRQSRQGKENYKQLRHTLAAEPEGWLVIDRGGQILFANPLAAELFGENARELKGQNFGLPTAEGTMEVEIVRPTEYGPQSAVVEIRSSAIEWNGEQAFLELVRDVTNHKRELRQAQEAVRRRDQFLATLSHELRNPLAAISSAAALVGSGALSPEKLKECANLIRRQCGSMTHLLDDLTNLSRVGRGKIEIKRSTVPVAQLVKNALETVRARAHQKGQALEVIGDESTEHCHIDEARIAQVLNNLLTNAVKYTPEGGRITVRVEPFDEEVQVSVADDGEGIESPMLEEIFQPFVQISQAVGTREDGLGIGLTLARKLTELNGGRLWAESAGANQGSTFFLALPRAKVDSAQLASGAEGIPSAVNESPLLQSPADPLRIAIVEDHPAVRASFSQVLEALGHTVFLATEGEAGVRLILEREPDLAVIDLGLPVLSGFDVARTIRREASAPPFLIALSGYGSETDKQQAQQAGFDLHLTKPVDLEVFQHILQEQVQEVIKQRRSKDLTSQNSSG
jgi:signal transduction histidine kinase/ActR/RegA family two-component response regulator